MAWENPVTTWGQAGKTVPAASDFNRIEGNIEELQNTKETPDGAQQKVNTHENKTSIHGATSAATANRIMMRDSAGRAKVAAPSASDDIARKAEVDIVQEDLDGHKADEAQAHGGVDAASILTKLQTVDGVGSGLDADFLRGETPQSLSQVAGTYNYVGGDSISAGGEREILIPIGESGKTHGNIMFIGEGRHANWYINTSPTGAAGLSFSPSNYQAGVRADYWDGNYTERQWAPREGLETIFGGTESDRHNWANIKYCYISGSNIVIRLKNTITSAAITTDQATILWRVFG